MTPAPARVGAQVDIDRDIAGKSAVLQDILADSDLSDDDERLIFELNTRPGLQRSPRG